MSWYNQTQEKFDAETYFPKPDIEQFPVSPVQITLGGPDSQWKAMQQLYFFMIMTATRKVQIQSPFFIPDESLLEAIKAAALSGVEVEIMASKHGTAIELAHRGILHLPGRSSGGRGKGISLQQRLFPQQDHQRRLRSCVPSARRISTSAAFPSITKPWPSSMIWTKPVSWLRILRTIRHAVKFLAWKSIRHPRSGAAY